MHSKHLFGMSRILRPYKPENTQGKITDAAETPKQKRAKIAENASNLDAMRKTIEDAASVSAGLWLSYLFVFFYLAVAAGAVTHVDLLLKNPVKLPFLNIELPLLAFFALAPYLFIISHAYTLVHLVMLAAKAGQFHRAMHDQLANEDNIQESLRRQLPSNIFVQFVAGPKDIREGGLGVLLKFIAWTTLVVGPVLLLLLFQIRFLPYHDELITTLQRLALLIDLALLWALWPAVLASRSQVRWPNFALAKKAAAASALVIGFSWSVATFPGERQDGRASTGPLSNTLVLTDFNVYESQKIDDPKKVEWREHLIDLQNRDLNGAIFTKANLSKANFLNARLRGASLDGAELQGATFYRADLQAASLNRANMQGASFVAANLKGASLDNGQLQGASLVGASLDKVSFSRAQLHGASLVGASMRAARLDGAQLQAASLDGANLELASLNRANLQGASLIGAQLECAVLRLAFVWMADLGPDPPIDSTVPDARVSALKNARIELLSMGPCTSGDDDTACTFEQVKKLIEQKVPQGASRVSALKQIEIASKKSKDDETRIAHFWQKVSDKSPDSNKSCNSGQPG